MNIAIIGYGKMGKEIEKIALERNHRIALIIDIENISDMTVSNLKKADVAIDFSMPATAYNNIMKCFEAGIPVVSGTTGWLDRYEDVVDICKKKNQAFFYASNFSVGVNIFFALNKYLAQIMNRFKDYDVAIKETHHVHKVDAPSGTAISLARDLIDAIERKEKWEVAPANDTGTVQITAIRENEIPGIHTVSYNSEIDELTITHSSKNRKGFAMGAVMSAEFIKDKKGCYTMADLLRLD